MSAKVGTAAAKTRGKAVITEDSFSGNVGVEHIFQSRVETEPGFEVIGKCAVWNAGESRVEFSNLS